MFSPMHVTQQEITVATLLRNAGYDTCQAGKWHLNGQFNLPGQPQPSDHGFNHWFSTQNNALPSHKNPDNFVRNGQSVGLLEGYSAQLQKLYTEVVDESPVRPNWEWPRFEGGRIRAAKEAGIWPTWKKPAKKSP